MNIFTTVLYQPLFNLLFGLVAFFPGENLGLGIIGLTLLIKLLLVPSSATAFRGQREMQAIQPEIDALRTEYKDKPEELNKKMLALYQEHNVNPFRSCLPLLLQLPILIVLYRVLISGIHPDNFDLLYSFVPAPAALNTIFLGINLATPNWMLAALAGILQFIQTQQTLSATKSKQSAPKQDGDQAADIAQQVTRRMVYVMPFITFFVTLRLPAALGLYWSVTTLFAIVQQWWLLRTHPTIATPHVSVAIRKK